MKKQLNQVRHFQETFKQGVNESPTLIPIVEGDLRYDLMKEENEEYLMAISDNDLVEVADSLADQLFVLLGTINAHGMQHIIEKIFDEVYNSNMSKLDANGDPIFRADGKVLKSKLFFKPNIKQFLP